jgi:L-lactate dehydrogenase complex protein LldF
MKLLARIFSSRGLFEKSQRLGRLGQKLSVNRGFIEHLPGPLAGWTTTRDVYPVAPQTFREWWEARS